MRENIRKERVEKYGSFLYCQNRDTLCFNINTPDGICEEKICCLDDPEYIALLQKIEKNRKKREKRKEEKHEEYRYR